MKKILQIFLLSIGEYEKTPAQIIAALSRINGYGLTLGGSSPPCVKGDVSCSTDLRTINLII